jgi:hypothetical protein
MIADILRERAVTKPEQVSPDLVPWLQPGHVLAYRLDPTRDIQPHTAVPWLAQPDSKASDVWHPSQVIQVRGVDGRRLNPHQYLVVSRHRLVDFLEFQDVG